MGVPLRLPPSAAAGGFTLAEVLAAVAILALGLVTLVGLRNDSVREVRKVVDYSDAFVLGARTMGEIETAESLEEGSDGGLFEDHPAYRWDVYKTKYEVDVVGLYFPGQERTAVPHKPKELLKIDLVISLLDPAPNQNPEVFRLQTFTKKRKRGEAW